MITQHRVTKIVICLAASLAAVNQASAVTNGIVSGGVDSVDGVVFNAATGANPAVDQTNNFLAIVVGSNYNGYSATIGNPPEGIPPGTAAQLQVNANSVVMNRNTLITNGGNLTVDGALGSNTIQSAGSNTIGSSGSGNNITATAINGVNNITATGTSGVNNIQAIQNNIGTTTPNSVNTIGNAGTSTNRVTGSTNAITATLTNTITGDTGNLITASTGNNSMTASAGMNTLSGQTGNTITAVTGSNQLLASAGQNTITGQTGNALTATTGNNAIAATAGSNSISANAANQSNTMSANGANGSNVIQATGTGGSNVVNAATNLMANAATYAGSTSAVQTSATGVDIKGGVINMGTTGTNTVNFGNSSGTTTLNFNNNRLQNVAPGIVGTDAVNLNQLKAVQNWAQNAINSNSQGIAGVAAATNLPGLNGNQKYNMGIAWGNYQTFNGVAIGGHARVSDNVTLKLSGSNSGNVYSGGVGLGIGF